MQLVCGWVALRELGPLISLLCPGNAATASGRIELASPNCLNLSGVQFESSLGYDKTHEADLSWVELTFLKFHKQFVCLWSANFTWWMCSSSPGEDQYVIQINEIKWFNISQRMSFIKAWDTAGALVRPKGIYSKYPSGVLNAIYHLSRSQMRTRLWALRRSRLVNIFASHRGSKEESVRGSGYLIFTVISFTSQ